MVEVAVAQPAERERVSWGIHSMVLTLQSSDQARAAGVRSCAEETVDWVTGDANGWELATTNPAGLLGSGQVMASYCRGP